MSWERYSSPAIETSAYGRIQFVERATPAPIHALIDMMDNEFAERRLIVAVGRARRLAVQSHQDELNAILGGGHSAGHRGEHGHGHAGASSSSHLVGGEVRKTVGDVAACLLVGSANTAALIVLQAAEDGSTE